MPRKTIRFQNRLPATVNISLAIIVLLALNGCAWILKPPPDDQYARQMVEKLYAYNSELKQFKSLAKTRVESSERKLAGRVALAAAAPNQMRVEWLNIMGQPLISLAGDGRTISIISHSGKRIYRRRQSPTALEPLIQIPMGIEDLQNLLAGRPPLSNFVSAQLVEKHDAVDVIALKNRWHSTLARLHIDRSQQQVQMMRNYDTDGTLHYQIDWLQWQTIKGYTIPRKVMVSAASGIRLTFTVERFWPDVDLPASTFVLSLPVN